MLKNHMEDILDHFLPSIIAEYNDICKCEKCLEDIKAIVLNNLKPLYSATEKGGIYLKINETDIQFRTDIINAIVAAIAIVSQNPKHK